MVTFDIINFILIFSVFILSLLAITFAGEFIDGWRWYEAKCTAMLTVGPMLAIIGIAYDCCSYFKTAEYLRNKFSGIPVFPAELEIGPLMTEKLFYDYKIISVNTVAIVICIGNGFQVSYLIQYFQLIFNYSPLIATCNFMPSSLSILSFVLLTGYVISKIGRIKEMTILAAITGLLGNDLLTVLKNTSYEAEKIIFVFLGGMSYGFIAKSYLMSVQRKLDRSRNRYKMLTKQLGFCIGSVLSTMIFNTTVINGIKSVFPQYSFSRADTLRVFRWENFDSEHSPFFKFLSKCI